MQGAVAAVCAPSAAAADISDPAAQNVTALDGTVVWVSGESGRQVLMQRGADGVVARVPGAPESARYGTIDLGRDTRGELVLSYMRCATLNSCVARRDDLQGKRSSFRGLTPAGCSLTTAPAVWRTRVAYGLLCKVRSRSGLWVKNGSRAARRLPLPRDAVRYGATTITSVDLRGERVAAVAADIYEYAFSQTVGGRRMESMLVAASEGESDAHARGLALGTTSTLWALTNASHAGDPNEALLFRLAGACQGWQRLANAPGPEEETGFRASDVAADGTAVWLVAPGVGIVQHEYAPERACS